MSARVHFSQADHQRITEAVADAERASDGEIVTIVADRSDAYHDVGLHYAIGLAFVALALIAAFPHAFEGHVIAILNSWHERLPLELLFTFALGVMIAKFLFIRYLLAIPALRMALTPAATKARRVHRRAIALFRVTVEGRTTARTGVLIYLSLAEHRAEIVADKAINDKVAADEWGAAMAALLDGVRADRAADGMVAAVERVGAVLATHFPRSEGDRNELPDRLITL